MAKTEKKAVETKDSGEKILSMVPAHPNLMVNFKQENPPAAEGGEPTTSTSARHVVALALCEDTDGNQYVRALTIEDITASLEGWEFVNASI